jgi:glycosyltransferase involved in cell wall biosynthesis
MLPLHRYIHSGWGSEWAWAINLARSVASQEIDFTAIVGQADPRTSDIIRNTGNRVLELGVGRERDFLSDLLFYSKLFCAGVKLVKKNRPNIIHHVFPLGYRIGFNPFILSQSELPFVVGPLLLPDFKAEGEGEDRLLQYLGVQTKRVPTFEYPKTLFSVLYRQTLMRCSHVIFDSEATRAVLSEYEPGLLRKRYSVLPTGGVDMDEFEYRKRTLASHNRSLTLGTLSFLRPKKHLDTLIRAVSLTKNHSVRVLIGGDGPIMGELRKLALEIGVENQVKFLGSVSRSRVPSFLSEIDILCSLHRIPYETMPSVQEAMMCGTPVIVSSERQHVIPEELPYGFVVDAERPDHVAYAIERFIDEPTLISELGATARTFAVSNFSLESVGDRMGGIYQSCMEN